MKNWSYLLLVVAAFLIGSGKGVAPTPKPDQVVVDVAPFPSDHLTVMVIEETSDRAKMPLPQSRILTSPKLFTWARTNGASLYVWDKDTNASRMPQNLQDAMKVDRKSLPWLLVSNKSKGYSGALPADEESTISLLEKFR